VTGPKSEGELHGDLPPALVESRIAPLLEKKNPSQNGIWRGQVLGGLVRESVIHETLARAFHAEELLESTAAQATERSSLASFVPEVLEPRR
jgi:hypothetical protein